MTRDEANRYLVRAGYPDATVNKAEGVWYLLGDDPSFVNHSVERCLHVVRLGDLTPATLDWKLRQLTARAA